MAKLDFLVIFVSCKSEQQLPEKMLTSGAGVYNNERSLFIGFFFRGLLGLGRPTAFAFFALRLQLPEVFSASLGDLPPTLPSKTEGGGVFLFRQKLRGLRLQLPD
jgi:hypothetical protein